MSNAERFMAAAAALVVMVLSPMHLRCVAAQGGGEYEAPPVMLATEALPPDLIVGPDHRVEDFVYNDGAINKYQVTSTFGRAAVRSTALLRLRIGELRALRRLEQLAATPFLLFTIQENDELTWRAICRADPNTDLFENGGASDAGISNLLATSVGYLWQLAQQNPYSVRLICGASPDWCEMITAVTYFELVTLTRCRDDLLVLRQARNVDIWSKLLAEGVRAEQQALAKHGLNYVIEKYLPQKLKKTDSFLP